jgi:hypothetical protein
MGLNIQPTLASIPNQTIIAGRTLLITNVAEDFLAPPQLLTFSLSAPAVGATINSSNGLFSWRPGIAQRGTTNLFTVVVSNNGLPSLGASQSFTASVQAPARPAFGTASVVGGNFQTWVSGDAGPDYSVYGSINLINWQLILTTNPVTLPFLFVDRSASNASKQFYQIQLGP